MANGKKQKKCFSKKLENSAEKKVCGFHRSIVGMKLGNHANPDLYLDVDGVILYHNVYNEWMLKFLSSARLAFSRVFWLSCWTCNGDATTLLKWHPVFKMLEEYKPLVWKNLKTEAIDWSRPFLWIEDGVLPQEREIFNQKAKAGQSLWEVRPGEWAMNARHNQKCKTK